MKTDVDGNILWEKKVVITRGWVQDYQVTDTDDGGFLIYPMDSRIIVKMDDKGNKIWERDNKTIPIYGCKMAYQTKDGGYIVLGNTWDDSLYEYEDIILLKLDSNGLLHEDHPHTTTEPDWPYLLAIIGILVLITADIIVLASILKKKRKCA